MSVNFTSDAYQRPANETAECCLCAQMSRFFTVDAPTDPVAISDLEKNADKSCSICHGSGIELVIKHGSLINFANRNAELILKALGLDYTDLYGECDVSDFRKRCIRAINSDSHETREPVNEKRYSDPGVNIEQLKSKIERLLDYVVRQQELGATKIIWS